MALNPNPEILNEGDSKKKASSFKQMKQKAKEDAVMNPVVEAKDYVEDVEMTDKMVAEYDRGMSDLLSNVVVVGTMSSEDQTCFDDFPKIRLDNGEIQFVHGSKCYRNAFEVVNSRFEHYRVRL